MVTEIKHTLKCERARVAFGKALTTYQRATGTSRLLAWADYRNTGAAYQAAHEQCGKHTAECDETWAACESTLAALKTAQAVFKRKQAARRKTEPTDREASIAYNTAQDAFAAALDSNRQADMQCEELTKGGIR